MKAGCYYCLKIFDAKEIKYYIDDGRTPLCPRCTIDSVVIGKNANNKKLNELHDKWFSMEDDYE